MKRFSALIFAVAFLVVVPFNNQKSSAENDFTNTILIVSQPFAVVSFISSEFVITLPPVAAGATTIDISLHRRVNSRDSLQAISQGGLTPKMIDTVTYNTSALLTRGNDLVLPIMLSPGQAATAGLDLKAYGVFPVSVTARDSSGTLASTLTFIARVDPADTSQSLTTALVIAEQAPPSLQPDGTTLVTKETRSVMRRLLEIMNSFQAPLAISIQPETLASLALSDDSGDATLLADLQNALAKRSLIMNTYVPMNPSLSADNKQNALFERQQKRGVDELQKMIPSAVTSNALWISHHAITRSGAALLGTLGIDSILLLAQAQDGALRMRESATIAHSQLSDNSLFSVRRADSAISTLLDGSTTNPVRTGILIAAEVLAARRDLLADATPVQDLALVLATTTGAAPDQQTVATLAAALGSVPGITWSDLSTRATPLSTTPSVVFSSKVLPRASKLSALDELITQQISLTTMLDAADPRIQLWNNYISAISATTIKASNPYISGLQASQREVTSAISRPSRNKFTLGSTEADIRLQLRNKSTSPLTVRVVLSSPKLKFPNKPPVIVLAAQSTTEVVVRTVVRSKGVSNIILRLTTPDGKIELTSPTLLTARVNLLAGLGQPISLVMLIGLLLWWALSWRSARRTKTPSPTTTVL